MRAKTPSTLHRPEDRLKAARICAGYPTAQAFADAHDLSAATYRMHEKGKDAGGRGMQKQVADNYADLLKSDGVVGVTGDWLRYGGDPQPDFAVRDRDGRTVLAVEAKTLPRRDWTDDDRARLLHRQVRDAVDHGGANRPDLVRDLLAQIIPAVDAELARLGIDQGIAPAKRVDLYFAIHDLEVLRLAEAPQTADAAGGADGVVDLARYRQLLSLAS